MLRARHLTKQFGGNIALRDLHFEVGAGEIHALCGENGAGKSTLIKVLSGVYPYGSYEGSFEVAGREARFRSVRDAGAAGIAVIHQEMTSIDELSVADNVFLGCEISRRGFLRTGASRRRTTELFSAFGMPLDPDARMGDLGVGQKQLVEIVKAMARNARILVLDEPTAALAEHEVELLMGMLSALRLRGVACIYISHRLSEVFRIADRITVLRDGAAVSSLPRADADEATVVRHMIGREITSMFGRSAAPIGNTLLEVKDLTVADDAGRTRLEGISFELRAGEVLGLGGLMGAGRTKLLLHLFGAWGRRIVGGVVLGGRALSGGDVQAALDEGVAFVAEDRRRQGLFLQQSVGFNLSLSAIGDMSWSGFIRSGQEAAQIQHWLNSLRVKAPDATIAVHRLSGGNQQKVIIGRALMRSPRVVLLDEPTRGIDVGAKFEIYSLVNRLTQQGCAVVCASSELPELLGLSDRVLVLRDGRSVGIYERGVATAALLMQAAVGGPSEIVAAAAGG